MACPEVKCALTSVDTVDGLMYVFPFDDPIGRSLRIYGEWARHELRVLCGYLGLGSSVVDVGANVGTHAVAFARRVGPTGSVLAIEPQSAVFDLLERNVAANGLSQIRAIRAAVGASEGALTVPAVDYSAHANVGAVQLRPVDPNGVGERVPLIPLDQLDLTACHLVKVDAEGFGAQVLAGMRETVSRRRPVIAAECSSVDEAADLLRAADWPDYDLVLLRAAAFNAGNFAGCEDNFFGVATETTLLFVPHELKHLTPASQPGAEMIPVCGLDDLAAAILSSPRFGDASPHDRDAVWLGEALRAADASLNLARAEAEEIRRKSVADVSEMESRLKAARAEAEESQRKLATAGSEVKARLEFRNEALTTQLRIVQEQLRGIQGHLQVAQEQLRSAQDDAAHAKVRIAALYASTSWRLMGPLRRIARLLKVRP